MVSGDSLKTLKYWDDETQAFIEIEMSVRDHLLFRFLSKLEGALRSIKIG